MELIIDSFNKKIKEVSFHVIYKKIIDSEYKVIGNNCRFEDSIYSFHNCLNPIKIIFQYASNEQLGCLNEEIERTRRILKRIENYIPDKIEKVLKEKDTLEKQSFRLTPNQYKKSIQKIKITLKKYKVQLKEYKVELKYRRRFIYKVYRSFIPSLYIVKRKKYQVVQCKWKFLGIIQKQLHLGTWNKVGSLENIKLKINSINIIKERYSGTFNNFTLKWIESEERKIKKWCIDMNYQVRE